MPYQHFEAITVFLLQPHLIQETLQRAGLHYEGQDQSPDRTSQMRFMSNTTQCARFSFTHGPNGKADEAEGEQPSRDSYGKKEVDL